MSSSTEIEANIKPKPTAINPWSKIAEPNQVQTLSLTDVMSEQYVKELQDKEDQYLVKIYEANSSELVNQQLDLDVANNEIDSDLMLAQLLQLEFDKEYDDLLRHHENFKNKNSKISISYDKFTKVHPVIDKDEKELNRLNQEDLTSSSESEDELEKIPFNKGGVHGKGENMISKHDPLLASRSNAYKMRKFPPEFETGDSHSVDIKLSNSVFNTLKIHSLREEKRNNRLHDKKDISTNEMSLDPKTRLLLFKLVNADLLESIGGIISTGKEATIFYAPGGKAQEVLVPSECVVKVFKTTLNEFKTREKYIGDDYRFKDRFKHLNPQKIVRLWAEKEMHNLMKMRKFEIPCPDVVILKKHLLVMSFIGEDNVPAPKLKDANLNDEELKNAYEQCLQLLKDLYWKCNLVHADFSQYNLLWHKNKVWVIDVSQSVEPIHPMGLEFLLRDCTNVFKFFTSRKLENVKNGEEIFNEITKMNFKGTGSLFLSELQRYTKEKQMELTNALNNSKDNNEESFTTNKNKYNFEYFFEKSVNKKKKEADESDENEKGDEEDVENE